MKFIEPGAAEAVRELFCFWCGWPGIPDVAHIYSRGAGEVTIRENTVPLCRLCHTRSHYSGKPSREDMLAWSAETHGVDADDIRLAVFRIRALAKGSDAEARAIVSALRGHHDLGDDDDLPTPQTRQDGSRARGVADDEADGFRIVF